MKQKFSLLTDDDLMVEDGKKDELVGLFQIKPGKTKEEIRELISRL